MRISFTFLLLAIPTILISQKNVQVRSTEEIIQESYSYQQESKYTDAIQGYKKISINDTNYAMVRHEIARCHVLLKEYTNAKTTLTDLIQSGVKYNFQQASYSLLGWAYEESGDSLGSLQIYKDGIKKFPMSYELHYRLGLNYKLLKEYDKALEQFKLTVKLKKDYAPVHYSLGIMAANEEHYAEAMLSLINYIVINPTDENTLSVVYKLEDIASGNYLPEPKGIKLDDTDPFEVINLMLKNKVALDKKYKVSSTIKSNFSKQLHFLLSNAKYDDSDMNFWNQYYLDLYQEVLKHDSYDQLCMLASIMLESKDVQKKLKPKINSIKEFINWFSGIYASNAEMQYFHHDGELKKVYINYDEEGRISYYGVLNEQNEADGNFYYYHPNGSNKLNVKYVKNEPQDTLKYFNEFNGDVELIRIIDKNDSEKVHELRFYASGELNEDFYKYKDMIQDSAFLFYRDGTHMERLFYKDDQRTGAYISYYENGNIRSKSTYVNGNLDGTYTSWYVSGKVKQEGTYKNGIANGLWTSYYDDGQKKVICTYVDGELDGSFEAYHPNGKLQEKSTYKKGITIGKYTEYYSNGGIESSMELDEKGKSNGTKNFYDTDGLKYMEMDFTSDEIKEIRYVSKTGIVSQIAKKKGNTVNYQLVYPNGKTYCEGKLENNLRVGQWRFYDYYGNLETLENYVDGLLQDTVYSYYPNGKIHTKVSYVDNQRNGLFLEFDPRGNLLEEGIYLDNEVDREWFTYHPNGAIKNAYYYINGELNGLQLTYHANGNLEVIEEYVNGEDIYHKFMDSSGVFIEQIGQYNGKIELKDVTNSFVRFSATFRNGMNNGPTFTYGPNKLILVKGEYQNGSRKGNWIWNHPNGKVKETCSYKNGRMDGKDVEFFYTGIQESEYNFIDGKKNGAFSFNHSNGKVRLSGTMLDDERHGEIKSYSVNGTVYFIRNYNLGQIVSYIVFDKKGNPLPIKVLTKEMDSIQSYFKNGQLALSCQRKGGELQGAYLVYHENGQLKEKEMYKDDRLEGKAVAYYVNGKLEEEKNYVNGSLHGVCTEYFENGQKRLETEYFYGEIHGKMKEFDSNGKLLKTYVYVFDELVQVIAN